MTEEEKRLLLVDLCNRIPYGVKVNINSPIEEQNQMELFDVNLESETIGVRNGKWMFRAVPVEDEEGRIVKPYLRPMSSMTEEEEKEFNEIIGYKGVDVDGCTRCDNVHTMYGIYIPGISNLIDWLLAHHIDYHGLIPMGLALEVPEGMYDKEESKILVPKTVGEALFTLEKILSDEDREYLLKNGAVSMHDSLGRWIRNEWGLWTGSELKDELMDKGFEHPDDMSNYIIEEFIKYWNEKGKNI